MVSSAVGMSENMGAGNALARVQRVHKHADFEAFSSIDNPQILRPSAFFYRTDCTCRTESLTLKETLLLKPTSPTCRYLFIDAGTFTLGSDGPGK